MKTKKVSTQTKSETGSKKWNFFLGNSISVPEGSETNNKSC